MDEAAPGALVIGGSGTCAARSTLWVCKPEAGFLDEREELRRAATRLASARKWTRRRFRRSIPASGFVFWSDRWPAWADRGRRRRGVSPPSCGRIAARRRAPRGAAARRDAGLINLYRFLNFRRHGFGEAPPGAPSKREFCMSATDAIPPSTGESFTGKSLVVFKEAAAAPEAAAGRGRRFGLAKCAAGRFPPRSWRSRAAAGWYAGAQSSMAVSANHRAAIESSRRVRHEGQARRRSRCSMRA